MNIRSAQDVAVTSVLARAMTRRAKRKLPASLEAANHLIAEGKRRGLGVADVDRLMDKNKWKITEAMSLAELTVAVFGKQRRKP